MSGADRKQLGLQGRQHVEKNYSFDKYCQGWIDIMLAVHEKYGSWDDRQDYKPWDFKEVS
jgi:hypothetical protein